MIANTIKKNAIFDYNLLPHCWMNSVDIDRRRLICWSTTYIIWYNIDTRFHVTHTYIIQTSGNFWHPHTYEYLRHGSHWIVFARNFGICWNVNRASLWLSFFLRPLPLLTAIVAIPFLVYTSIDVIKSLWLPMLPL